nr:unnamed protein product [Fasciola hepatica]
MLCPICHDASLWEHRTSCPKERTWTVTASTSGAFVEAEPRPPEVQTVGVPGDLISVDTLPIGCTSVGFVPSATEDVQLGRNISITINVDVLQQWLSDLHRKRWFINARDRGEGRRLRRSREHQEEEPGTSSRRMD